MTPLKIFWFLLICPLFSLRTRSPKICWAPSKTKVQGQPFSWLKLAELLWSQALTNGARPAYISWGIWLLVAIPTSFEVCLFSIPFLLPDSAPAQFYSHTSFLKTNHLWSCLSTPQCFVFHLILKCWENSLLGRTSDLRTSHRDHQHMCRLSSMLPWLTRMECFIKKQNGERRGQNKSKCQQ